MIMNEVDCAQSRFGLLNYIPVGICILRSDFTLLFWNSCLEEWTGINKEHVLGRDVREQFPHLAEPMFAGRFETLFHGGPPVLFSSQLHKYIIPARMTNGEMRAQRAVVTAIPSLRGQDIYALVVVEDVTDLTSRIRDYRTMRDTANAEAVKRKKAEQSVRIAHDKLERRVEERTAELARANEILRKEVLQRKRAEADLVEAHAQTELLLTSISSIMIGIDKHNRIIQWNATAEKTFGMLTADVLGREFRQCGIEWDWAEVMRYINQCRQTGGHIRFGDTRCKRADGSEGILGLSASPIIGQADEKYGVLLLGADKTDRRNLENQLNQAQKLEAMGQLAAGIAHEINTPTQYVGDNTRFLQESFAEIGNILEKCRCLLQAPEGSVPAELLEGLRTAFETADTEYLIKEVPKAILQSLEGIERVTRIVRSMKEFSHPCADDKTAVDLNKAIESTTTLCRNEWKYTAEMRLDLEPDLPLVSCLPGDLNQVILNLVINAAHAIEDVVGEGAEEKGIITVSTRLDGNSVEIYVSDTGCGIPEENRPKIFDLFFTTKDVGRGTGQGLTIARAIVVEKHGGTLDFKTETDKGTTFIIRLPINPVSAPKEQALSETETANVR